MPVDGFREAERAFREAMEYPDNLGVGRPYKPQQEEQLYWLGVALAAQGKSGEARIAWQQAADQAKG